MSELFITSQIERHLAALVSFAQRIKEQQLQGGKPPTGGIVDPAFASAQSPSVTLYAGSAPDSVGTATSTLGDTPGPHPSSHSAPSESNPNNQQSIGANSQPHAQTPSATPLSNLHRR